MVCGVHIYTIFFLLDLLIFHLFQTAGNNLFVAFKETSQHLITLICVGEGKYCQEKLFLSFFMKADLRFFLCVHGLLK